jgi:hypothetical protein
MARIRYNRHYSDTRAELAEYKDVKRGALEDAFWNEDELVDHRPFSKKKKKKRKRGCPQNNGRSHVYVWVDYDSMWLTDYEQKICCGCLHKAPGRSFRKKSRVV